MREKDYSLKNILSFVAFGALVIACLTWVIHWGAGEWFLAYGILNVMVGLAVVAHHDYTEWKENQK